VHWHFDVHGDGNDDSSVRLLEPLEEVACMSVEPLLLLLLMLQLQRVALGALW